MSNKPYGNGKCAQTIREGLDKAGYKIEPTKHAKNYGPKLEKAGFEKIATNDIPKDGYKSGDIAVIQPHNSQKINSDGEKSGHMAAYDGKDWHSDFKQNYGLHSSKLAQDENPDYAIYRDPNW